MLSTRIRQHKILTALLAIVAVLLLAIIAIVVFSEPLIRSLTETKGGEKIGRELKIDGAFRIRWHWTYTEVHAENIRMGNAPGYPEPNMLTIDALDFTFKPLKLLVAQLEFGTITLNKPQLILDKKSAEDMNWNFPTLSKENIATDAALADNRHDFPIFQKLELKQGHIIYRDAVKSMNLNVDLDSVSGHGGKEGKDGKDKTDEEGQTDEDDQKDQRKEFAEGFKISGTGSMQKQKFTLSAMGGSLETLRDSSKQFPLHLKLTMGATEVLVDGSFKDPIKLTGINASLKMKGHTLSDLFYFTAIPLPPTPPYTLEGQLTKTDGVWGYQDFKGKVGGSDLGGDLTYDTSKKRGFLKANLVSNVLDSADLGGFIGLSPSNKNAAPEQKQAAAEDKASAKLIPDVPLKLERLRATDLDVTLKAAKINAPSLPFKGMEVRFDLRDGLLKLDPLNVVLADGTLDGAIEIDAKKDIPPMKLNLNLHKLSLGQFFNNTRFAGTTEGFFGGKVNIAGTGSSLADVLASSNGQAAIIMSGGKISQLLVEGADLDIAQALPLFLGKDKSTKIRCGVTDFDVKDGTLTSKALVLDTHDSLLTGNVAIDLKHETIKAKLDAKPKDSSLFAMQIPITVTGQLKTPSVGLDSKKAGEKGALAVALGTLLTPFVALLPFIEKGEVQNADCRALIANARK